MKLTEETSHPSKKTCPTMKSFFHRRDVNMLASQGRRRNYRCVGKATGWKDSSLTMFTWPDTVKSTTKA